MTRFHIENNRGQVGWFVCDKVIPKTVHEALCNQAKNFYNYTDKSWIKKGKLAARVVTIPSMNGKLSHLQLNLEENTPDSKLLTYPGGVPFFEEPSNFTFLLLNQQNVIGTLKNREHSTLPAYVLGKCKSAYEIASGHWLKGKGLIDLTYPQVEVVLEASTKGTITASTAVRTKEKGLRFFDLKADDAKSLKDGSSSVVYYILNHQGVVGRVECATLPTCIIAKAKAVWSGDWIKSCKGVVDICTARLIHSLLLTEEGKGLLLGDKDFFKVQLEYKQLKSARPSTTYYVVNTEGYVGKLDSSPEAIGKTSILSKCLALYNVTTQSWVKGGEHGLNLQVSPVSLSLVDESLRLVVAETGEDFIKGGVAPSTTVPPVQLHSSAVAVSNILEDRKNLAIDHAKIFAQMSSLGLLPTESEKSKCKTNLEGNVKLCYTVKDKERIAKLLEFEDDKRKNHAVHFSVRFTQKGKAKVTAIFF